MTEPTDDILRRWLLQRLPPHDAEPLEQRLLADAAFGERLREAETDLLDDLVRGHLDETDRAVATRRFTATARDRLRLRIAAALARVAVRRSGAHRHAPAAQRSAGSSRRRRAAALGTFAAACALVIAVIGIRQRPDAGIAAPTITLMASQQRGAAATEIAIPRGAAAVTLQAEVDAADPATRYTLSVEGSTAPFTVHGMAVREAGPYRFVEARVPAAALADGEHRVRVAAERGDRASMWEIRTRSE